MLKFQFIPTVPLYLYSNSNLSPQVMVGSGGGGRGEGGNILNNKLGRGGVEWGEPIK